MCVTIDTPSSYSIYYGSQELHAIHFYVDTVYKLYVLGEFFRARSHYN